MKTILRILFVGFLLLVLAGAGFYFKINQSLILEDTRLFIEKNKSPKAVLEKLKIQHQINSFIFPYYLCQLKKLRRLKEGYYFFQKGTSCKTFIHRLRSGKQTPIHLTFNNTRTLEDFAGKIALQIKADSLSLLAFWKNKEVVASYGFDSANFIGMFLPNTYQVYFTTSAKAFTQRMHKEYLHFWNEKRKQKAKKLGLSPKQVSILASIVDEETSKTDEKSRIAGVYLNRLKRGIPLQADPTLKFAAGDFQLKRILNIHKKIESPYNTYKYKGLPPSPIRQPSIAGIEAVLNAEKHNYLYFCAKADFSGYHTFAKTLAAHNRNAQNYHRELNKRGIR